MGTIIRVIKWFKMWNLVDDKNDDRREVGLDNERNELILLEIFVQLLVPQILQDFTPLENLQNRGRCREENKNDNHQKLKQKVPEEMHPLIRVAIHPIDIHVVHKRLKIRHFLVLALSLPALPPILGFGLHFKLFNLRNRLKMIKTSEGVPRLFGLSTKLDFVQFLVEFAF